MACFTVKVEGMSPPWIEDEGDETNKNRFKLMNEVEFDAFVNSIDAKNTKEVEKFGIGVFQSYLAETHHQPSMFTSLGLHQRQQTFNRETSLDVGLLLVDNSSLDEIIAQFYASARTKRGEFYSKNSIMIIKFALTRYLKKLKNIDITDTTKFPKACTSFKGVVKRLKREGKFSKPHEPVSDEDMRIIQASLDLETSVGLQRKVFIDMMLYFCNSGGRERLRSMNLNDLIFRKSPDGYEYVEHRHNQTKIKQHSKFGGRIEGRIFEMPGHPRCPVKTLKKYLSKLDPTQCALFQRPKSKFCRDLKIWYSRAVIGGNNLSKLMKVISEEAGCKTIYSNHGLCITKISSLHSLGYSSRGMPVNPNNASVDSATSNYPRSSDERKNAWSENVSNNFSSHETNLQEEISNSDSDSDEEDLSIVEEDDNDAPPIPPAPVSRPSEMPVNRRILDKQQQQQKDTGVLVAMPSLLTHPSGITDNRSRRDQQQTNVSFVTFPSTSTPSSSYMVAAGNKRKLVAGNDANNSLLENSDRKCKQPKEDKDDVDHFLCSISDSMKRLPDRERAKLKFKIHQLVHQAELDFMFP